MDNSVIDITNEFKMLTKSFECKMCESVMESPMQITTCKHIICNPCLKYSNKKKRIKIAKCPICKSTYEANDVIPCNFMSEAIDVYKSMLQNLTFTGTSSWPLLNCKIVQYNELPRNSVGENQLHKACKKGFLAEVKAQIQENAHLNAKDHAGWTPLHEAVIGGKASCVKELLEAGANVNITGFDYKTPLHLAAEHNALSIISILLEYGANPCVLSRNGVSPIDVTTSEKAIKLMKDHFKEGTTNLSVFIRPRLKAFSLQPEQYTLRNGLIQFVPHQEFLISDEVTHLIVDENHTVDANYCIALLKGMFIVTPEFLKHPVRTNWLVETAEYVPLARRDTILAAAENSLLQKPKLFDNMLFFFVEYNEAHEIGDMKFSKQDLSLMVEAGGGSILRREPALRVAETINSFPYHLQNCPTLKQCSYYIIYMNKHKPTLCYNMKELRHKSSEWFVNCTLNFRITDDD